MQQSNNIRFEFRKGVKNAHKYNPVVQAGFDMTDRMANLLGHIPFGDLFGQTFDELIPRILPHVTRCADYGLIDDPEMVVELLSRLQQYNGSDSFVTLVDRICDDEGAAFPKQARAAIYQLWFFHGIRLPDVCPKHPYMLEVRQGIREVMQHAADFTYRSMWETPMTKDMKTAKIAIERAIDRNVICMRGPNGLCCSSGVCVAGNGNDNCYMWHGLCGTGSTFCGNGTHAADLSEDCGCC
jgi:hypothetical protein